MTGEVVATFLPSPLPPAGPALRLEPEEFGLLDRAERPLSRRDLAGELVGGVTEMLQTTKPTAAKTNQQLVAAGVLVERTRRKRDRLHGSAVYPETFQAESASSE